MPTLFLHIGLPKTGSSALQVWFADSSQSFEENGIHYPEIEKLEAARAGGITSGNGGLLARSYLPERDSLHLRKGGAAVQQRFEDALRQAEGDVLISSEMFVSGGNALKPIEVAAEVASRHGFRTHVVLFVRDQLSQLCSSYIQRLKRHQHTGTPRAFIETAYRNVSFLRYADFCKKISQVDGVTDVSALAFSHDGQKTIFERVRDVFGRPGISTPIDAKVVNTSLTFPEAQLMLMLNRYSPRPQISDNIVHDSIAVRGTIPSLKSVAICPPELRLEIAEYFADENKEFETEFMLKDGGLLSEKVKAHDNVPFLDIENDPIDNETVAAVLGGLMVRFDRRLWKVEQTVTALQKQATSVQH